MLRALVLVSSVLGAYLLGAIPTGFILTRFKKGVDIRNYGSGSICATNVLRSVGKIPAFITLIADILKGYLAIAFIANLSYDFVDYLDYDFWRGTIGLSAISGHIWPIFLKFKGGKGVATTIGVLAAITPISLILSLIVWAVVFYFTNYVSLGSLLFGVTIPVFSAIFNQPFYTILLGVVICIINTYRHKDNIKRLVKGEEHRTVLFKKK